MKYAKTTYGRILGVCVLTALLILVAAQFSNASASPQADPPSPPPPCDTSRSGPRPPICPGSKIYWVDVVDGAIRRANLDGSKVETLVSGLVFPQDIALNVAGGKMYWTDGRDNQIRRANLDGSDVEVLVTGVRDAGGIALDLSAGKMYWTHRGRGDGDPGKIRRANLDGSSMEDLFIGPPHQMRGIALDVSAGKMYWAVRREEDNQETVQRASLDGSNNEVVVPGARYTESVALDVAGGNLYLTNRGLIQRANLEPPNSPPTIHVIVRALVGEWGIALDTAAGKIYWSDAIAGKIQRANLDGSNIEDLITGISPLGIALDIAP